jgi:hypothetical protein
MELDIRGTNAATLTEYLVFLGGMDRGQGHVAGEGWQAVLVAGVYRFRDWEFPQVTVTLEGDPERVQDVARRLRLMAMRGGG